MRRFALSLFLAALTAVFSGCGGEAEVQAPTPTVVEQKKNKVSMVVRKFRDTAKIGEPLPEEPEPFGPQEQLALSAALSQTKKMIENSEDPEAAREQIADLLGARIEEVAGRRMWSHLGPYLNAYKTFRPQDTVYDQYMRQAQLQMNRPRFALRGFLRDYRSDTTTGIFRIRDPNSGETLEEHIRVGETVHGIHFVRVVGKDDAAEVEFLATGEVFLLSKGDDFQ